VVDLVISTSYRRERLAMVARSLNATLVATDMLGDIKIAPASRARDLGALGGAEPGRPDHRAGAGLRDGGDGRDASGTRTRSARGRA